MAVNPFLLNLGAVALGIGCIAAGSLLPLEADTRLELIGVGTFLLGYAVRRFGDLPAGE